MNIHFLGTCAGTEPLPGREHTSVVLECQDHLYWFDAGEGCSRTAYLMGLDLLKISRIVISHPHMDHVGGLGNLLWTIRKLTQVKKHQPVYGDVTVHMPNMETWQGLMMILENTEGNFETDFSISAQQVKEGIVFDDGIMKVTAYHNSHMFRQRCAYPQSFSYLIECEGKRLIYSGDLSVLEELDPLFGTDQVTDALIIESGHRCTVMDSIYEYCKDKQVKRIFFCHLGHKILRDTEAARVKAEELFEGRAVITEDGMTVCLE